MSETNMSLRLGRRRWVSGMLAGLVAVVAGREAGAVDLSGHWRGRWCSHTTGHQGPLRGSFCPLPDGDVQVNFRGRFFKILPFRYSVVLQVVGQQDDTLLLEGQSYLGRMFGTFCYRATATSCVFDAEYTSRKDCGRFYLERA